MHRFIARANVDHFIGLLNGNDLTTDKRTGVTGLLIAELDKLAHELENLEFVERKATEGRDRVNLVRNARNGHPFGTTEREHAERLLIGCENLQTVLEDSCRRLRAKINSSSVTISTGPRRNLID
ncbi:hypothetical protein [Bradyrhizobium sp. CCBAU 53338]|uniref:hypothetical protein n=1 Tax=Bradyrhizobium sp. CCBAU 53338 TaxID=1325111 RepID=UPI00188D14B4|nr:hypothetical protein [Bradyrhizobium sp. CCBAU 53338]QOZ54658.1 hypothetical protein XH90_27245 [Bradyrhizobium sp. CCBAU 53338]